MSDQITSYEVFSAREEANLEASVKVANSKSQAAFENLTYALLAAVIVLAAQKILF